MSAQLWAKGLPLDEAIHRFTVGDDPELDTRLLVQDALGIFVVSFGSGIITARSIGARNRYRVEPNRELFGFGAANIASGLRPRRPLRCHQH